jgi:ABC-type lipopolysaccharide export system ATPase subunit
MAKRKSSRRKGPKQSKEGFTVAEFKTPGVRDYVVAELRYESPVAFTSSGFSARAEARTDAGKLNDVLEKFDIASVRSQFGMKVSEARARMELASALPSEPSVRVLAA